MATICSLPLCLFIPNIVHYHQCSPHHRNRVIFIGIQPENKSHLQVEYGEDDTYVRICPTILFAICIL